MELTVRNATRDDYIPLCELFDQLDALHRDNLPNLFQKPRGAPREQDYYLGLLADGNVGIFVASTDDRLVGFVHALVKDTPHIPILVPKRYAVVDAIVVSPGYQNQGLGSMLMDKAQGWSLGKGATSIELNVYEFNETAISFYERLGYRTLSRKMQKELGPDKPSA